MFSIDDIMGVIGQDLITACVVMIGLAALLFGYHLVLRVVSRESSRQQAYKDWNDLMS